MRMRQLQASRTASELRRFLLTLALAVFAVFAVTTIADPEPASAATCAKKKKKAAGDKEKKEKASTKKPKKGKDAAEEGKAEEEGEGGQEVAGPEGEKEAEPAEDPLKRQGAAQMKVETAIDQKTFQRTQQADAKRDEAIEELKKLI